MGSSFLTSTWFFSQPLFWSARRGSQQDGHVSPGGIAERLGDAAPVGELAPVVGDDLCLVNSF